MLDRLQSELTLGREPGLASTARSDQSAKLALGWWGIQLAVLECRVDISVHVTS